MSPELVPDAEHADEHGHGPAGAERESTDDPAAAAEHDASCLLLLLPLITMRTYSEEKRSGTIELLLTSPITDVQIILGKFLGALALYARDDRRSR